MANDVTIDVKANVALDAASIAKVKAELKKAFQGQIQVQVTGGGGGGGGTGTGRIRTPAALSGAITTGTGGGTPYPSSPFDPYRAMAEKLRQQDVDIRKTQQQIKRGIPQAPSSPIDPARTIYEKLRQQDVDIRKTQRQIKQGIPEAPSSPIDPARTIYEKLRQQDKDITANVAMEKKSNAEKRSKENELIRANNELGVAIKAHRKKEKKEVQARLFEIDSLDPLRRKVFEKERKELDVKLSGHEDILETTKRRIRNSKKIEAETHALSVKSIQEKNKFYMEENKQLKNLFGGGKLGQFVVDIRSAYKAGKMVKDVSGELVESAGVLGVAAGAVGVARFLGPLAIAATAVGAGAVGMYGYGIRTGVEKNLQRYGALATPEAMSGFEGMAAYGYGPEQAAAMRGAASRTRRLGLEQRGELSMMKVASAQGIDFETMMGMAGVIARTTTGQPGQGPPSLTSVRKMTLEQERQWTTIIQHGNIAGMKGIQMDEFVQNFNRLAESQRQLTLGTGRTADASRMMGMFLRMGVPSPDLAAGMAGQVQALFAGNATNPLFLRMFGGMGAPGVDYLQAQKNVMGAAGFDPKMFTQVLDRFRATTLGNKASMELALEQWKWRPGESRTKFVEAVTEKRDVEAQKLFKEEMEAAQPIDKGDFKNLISQAKFQKEAYELARDTVVPILNGIRDGIGALVQKINPEAYNAMKVAAMMDKTKELQGKAEAIKAQSGMTAEEKNVALQSVSEEISTQEDVLKGVLLTNIGPGSKQRFKQYMSRYKEIQKAQNVGEYEETNDEKSVPAERGTSVDITTRVHLTNSPPKGAVKGNVTGMMYPQ